jgi:C-terminal processing protease CtpA/Prc
VKKLKKIVKWFLIVILFLSVSIFLSIRILVTPDKVVKQGELKDLTSEEKLEDFRYLYTTLKDSFPFFEIEKEKTNFDWLANKEVFEKQITATKNNEEFYQSLKGILSMIQNGHTGLLSPQRYYDSVLPTYNSFFLYPWKQIVAQKGVQNKYDSWSKIVKESIDVLPIKMSYIEGKYVVLEDHESIKKGYVIDSIDDKAIDEYFKDNLDKYYLNFDDKRNKTYVHSSMLPVEEGKSYKVKFLSQEGEKLIKNIHAVKYEQKSSTIASSTSSTEKILKQDKVAYLKVSSMSSRTLQSDKIKILEFYNSIKEYPYLIIDIRGNGGGTDNYWHDNIVAPLISSKMSYNPIIAFKGDYSKPFRRGKGITTKSIDKLPENYKNRYTISMDSFTKSSISVSPKTSIGFKGKIYLLVDDRVYSSSESFAAFSKNTGFAQLVGTTTGGDGIGVDPCITALPNSGLLVRFSLDMGVDEAGNVNEKTHTKPDIYAETSYKDFMNGKDTVLEKVLELCK